MNDETTPAELHKLAIDAALKCNWQDALDINSKLETIEPENTECLNRMAKAYFELGKYTDAKKIYQKVLEIDPYNTIAEKNFKRVSAIKKDSDSPSNSSSTIQSFSAASFLDEPGTTKSVSLVKVAEPQRLLVLSAGSLVNMVVKNRGISVTDQSNRYLGAMPDDVAHHILKLIKGGNKYQAFIRQIKPNGLTILVREVFRSKKFKNQASFLDETRLLTFSSDNISAYETGGKDSDEEMESDDSMS